MSESNIKDGHHLTEYRCTDCGQDIYSNRRPDPIRWTDNHICEFEVACCLECSYWDKRSQEKEREGELFKKSVSKQMDRVIEDQIDELNSRIK